MKFISNNRLAWHAKETKSKAPSKRVSKAKNIFFSIDRTKNEDKSFSGKAKQAFSGTVNENPANLVKYKFCQMPSYILLKGNLKYIDTNSKYVSLEGLLKSFLFAVRVPSIRLHPELLEESHCSPVKSTQWYFFCTFY